MFIMNIRFKNLYFKIVLNLWLLIFIVLPQSAFCFSIPPWGVKKEKEKSTSGVLTRESTHLAVFPKKLQEVQENVRNKRNDRIISPPSQCRPGQSHQRAEPGKYVWTPPGITEIKQKNTVSKKVFRSLHITCSILVGCCDCPWRCVWCHYIHALNDLIAQCFPEQCWRERKKEFVRKSGPPPDRHHLSSFSSCWLVLKHKCKELQKRK